MPTRDGMGTWIPPDRTGPEPCEAAVGRLVADHPDAVVFAVTVEGSPALVPLPAGLVARAQDGPDYDQSLQETLLPEDRAVVARLWGTARGQRAAAGLVRRRDSAEAPAMLYLFDFRPRHDLMVGVFTPGDATRHPAVDDVIRVNDRAPRLARATRDASAIYTSVDDALTRIVGWTAEELLGHRALEFIHPDDHDSGIAAWMELLESPGSSRSARLRHRHRDGSWVWLEITNHNRLDEPAHADILSDIVDISEEMGALEALRAREQLLGQLTEAVPVGLFHIDLQGRLLFANGRLHEITGAPPASPLERHLLHVVPEDGPKIDAAVRAAIGQVESDVEIRLLPPGGHITHCLVSIRPLRDEGGDVVGLTGCVEDVTIAVRNREELEARATSDPLTQCLNRGATLAVLQDLLDDTTAEPVSSGTAVIFVDLDRFKPVNDELGHAAGDELLVRVAEKIRASVRAGDIVGRFGGDEFVVICPEVPSSEDALRIAQSMAARAFEAGLKPPGSDREVRASFGVAWTNRGVAEATELIRQADTAMYHSKHAGRSEPVIFDQALA